MNLGGEPLIRDTALDAVSPSRVPIISCEGPAFGRLPRVSYTVSMVRFQTERCANVCGVQCWVHNEQLDMEASCRTRFFELCGVLLRH